MSAPVSVASSSPWPSRIRVGAPADLLDEPVVDRVLDDRPAARRADLAAVGERRGQRVVDRGLEVGVVEHDVRALAAELHGDPLHVPGRAVHERPPGLDPAGQRDEVDVRASRRAPGRPASPGPEDEVGDAGRQAGLLEQAGQGMAVSGVTLGGLHDHRVPGGEGRGHLPGELQERVVPRPDQAAHPDRLVDDPADRRRACSCRPAGRRPCRPGRRSSGRRGRRRRCPSGSRASPCRC